MRAAGAGLLLGLTATGCTPAATGDVWQVLLVTASDECTGSTEPYQETYDYVLNFDGSDVTVAVDTRDGPVTFATGTLQGCHIDYASVLWEEYRDGDLIQWRIEGEAEWRAGGLGCNLPQGTDWLGTETVIVATSEHPDVPTGCRYIMDSSGTYEGTL